MKYKLHFLLIFLNSLAFSQGNKVLFYSNQIDTLSYSDESIERNKFYKIEDLATKSDEFIFRSWAGNSCVEISKNGNDLSGRIYFAVEGFNKIQSEKIRFSKSYKLSKKITSKLFSLIDSYEFVNRKYPSILVPVVQTFETKIESKITIYSTDSPQFEYKIFDIIPMNYYWDKFDNEIPFLNYTYWDLIEQAKGQNETPYYLVKKND